MIVCSTVIGIRRMLPGQFFGDVDAGHRVGAFSLSVVRPTVPESHVERHTHEGAHFVFVLAGAYVTAAQNAPAICRAPLLVFNPPGTTHRDRFRGKGGRFLAIAVDDTALSDCNMPPLATAFFDEPRLRLVAGLVEGCRSSASPLDLEALATELVSTLGLPQSRETGVPPWLHRACELLRETPSPDVALAELAAAAGVHPAHFARVFRRHFGCAPGTYLRRCRIERASRLLRDTRLDIARIALDCGFADQSHFTKVFRAAIGIPPGAYRSVRGRYSGR